MVDPSEQPATLNNSSNDSGDLNLSCSVSSVESEESEVSEVKRDLETVEAYQFELVVHQRSQIQRQKMTTLETKKDSAAETGKNLHA